jgi:hypothetical protein
MPKQQNELGRDVNVMKHAVGRRVLRLALALLLPFALSVAGPASAAGVFAVGGGQSFAGGRDYVQFAFSAQNAPDGTASGHITLDWPPASNQPASAHGQILANVVCLVVNGNVATAYGIVTKSVNPDVPFTPDWVGITVTDQPDTFIAFFGLGAPPCTPLGFQGFPLSSGSIVVQN